MLKVIDNFMDNAELLRKHGIEADFSDFECEDGNTYKRVCFSDVPDLQSRIVGITKKLALAFGAKPWRKKNECAC